MTGNSAPPGDTSSETPNQPIPSGEQPVIAEQAQAKSGTSGAPKRKHRESSHHSHSHSGGTRKVGGSSSSSSSSNRPSSTHSTTTGSNSSGPVGIDTAVAPFESPPPVTQLSKIDQLKIKMEQYRKQTEFYQEELKARNLAYQHDQLRLDNAEQEVTMLNLQLQCVKNKETMHQSHLAVAQSKIKNASLKCRVAEQQTNGRALIHSVNVVKENITRISQEFNEVARAEAGLAQEFTGPNAMVPVNLELEGDNEILLMPPRGPS